MDPFERDLTELLARREAPAGLKACVMNRVRAEAERSAAVVEMPQREPRRGWPKRVWTSWRWAAAAGLAASLSVGLFVRDRNRRAAAEQAEAELVDALQVAGLKIRLAQQKALGEGETR